MENKIKAQRATIAKFLKFCDSVMKSPESKSSKGYLEGKTRMVESLWTKIDTVNDEIVEGFTSEEEIVVGPPVKVAFDAMQQEYEQAFQQLDQITVQICMEVEKLTKPPTAQVQPLQLPENLVLNANNKTNIKLKPIDIPTFSGDYKQWISFRSMFDSLIHTSKEFSKLQKIHYLKSCLDGEAKRMISQFDTTEESYDPAYASITERFHNEVILVDTHVISILSQPNLTTESSQGLKELMDVTTENLRALKTLKIDTDTWDPILLLLLVQKLDSSTRRLWEQKLVPKVRPTMKEFLEFLGTRFHALGCQQNFTFSIGSSANNSRYNKVASSTDRSYNKPFRFSGHQTESTTFPPRVHQNFHNYTKARRGCPFRCSNTHEVLGCERFTNADPRTRHDLVACARLCKNCLKGHSGQCGLSPGCSKCGQNHHNLLHFDELPSSSRSTINNTESRAQSDGKQQQVTDLKTHHAHVKRIGDQGPIETLNHESIAWDEPVLLATAIILVRSARNKQYYPFRALLDQASEASYASEYATQVLGLKKQNVFANTTGLGGTVTGSIKNVVNFEIGSKLNTSFSIQAQAPVVSKITNPLPSSYLKKGEWKHIQGLPLADPEYNVPKKIDFLLGAPLYGYLLLPGLVKSSSVEPVAQNTEFGWILSGPTRETPSTHSISNFHLRLSVDDQLKKFFEQEEISKERILTKEETECERFYMENYRRKEDGRFVVALPFKKDPSLLGSTKGQAISRLMKLESKFKSNPSLKEEYTAILQEYENLGHTTLLGPLKSNQQEAPNYYLPHHAVFKPESTTTKTRVVFDASAPGTNGKSLNDLLITGPTLQEDLFSILLRWRCYEYIFSADIAKMYRQVEVRLEDRKYQKFLFRKDGCADVQEYQHNMVTFGVTSATYLAVKSLQQLAIEEKKNFPEASKVILRDFYMDDGMSGSDTELGCIKMCKDLKKLLAKGKFDLRKFISNSTTVLESIPEADRELKLPLEINLDNTIKTLGVRYHPTSDSFQFKVKLPSSTEWPTKRSLLSETAKLFDPLGWLAPVVIRAKILFQKLWQEGLTWNQKLPEHIAKTWMEFRDELHMLEKIRIPRWNGKGIQSKIFELHGFSDASETAYSAVIFARNVNQDGSIQITNLASKTRVAPIKLVTLPRLELCGLGLLANLMEVIKKALDVEDNNTHAWTDSTVVLGWLRTDPAKLKTFVANRVVEIHNTFNVNQCHHIEGTNNPADCASRGIKPSELENHDLWWNGPVCLQEHKSSWEQELTIPETTLELKTKYVSTLVVVANDDLQEIFMRYSSFNQLVRITAICLKFIEGSRRSNEARVTTLCLTFINKLRDKIRKPRLLITSEDFRKAEQRIIRLCQNKDFPREVQHLTNKKPVNKKSKVLPLNPFLDSNNCLRVGGRLSEANMPYNRKHPYILEQGGVAELIIADAHKRSLHGGVKLTINLVREAYWIINLRRQVKRHIRNCVTCCRFRKKGNSEQIMADLPWARVNATASFIHTGLDYAGPFNLKASNVRSPPLRIKATIINGEVVKAIPKVPVYEGYIAVFICLSTKAVHLEVVSDKTTEAFLAAFDRFSAHRGTPECCYSDNAQTFTGAKNILALERENSILDYDRVTNHTSKGGTDWKFITPRAPNQGGIWEAAVKSMKHHLKRIIGEATLTFEEMSTILAKIEACLNSRPLCPLNDDPEDLSVLTPGHFLIGRPLVTRPQGNSKPKTGGIRDRWRLVQRIQQDFWDSWHHEYLNELQTRSKWQIEQRNFMEGDMVLMKEDNMVSTKWPLGRVIKVHPSGDGIVRSVTLKTTNEAGKPTELKRPILKLCLLPVNGDEDSTEDKEVPKNGVSGSDHSI